MAKKGTKAYEIIQAAKKENKEIKNSVKKKVEDMTDAEKVEYYKAKVASLNKRIKSLSRDYKALEEYVNNNGKMPESENKGK